MFVFDTAPPKYVYNVLRRVVVVSADVCFCLIRLLPDACTTYLGRPTISHFRNVYFVSFYFGVLYYH